jgi:hypothetical protein
VKHGNPSTSCKQANNKRISSASAVYLSPERSRPRICLICRLNKSVKRNAEADCMSSDPLKAKLLSFPKHITTFGRMYRSETERNEMKGKNRIIHDDDIIQELDVYLLELNICLFE